MLSHPSPNYQARKDRALMTGNCCVMQRAVKKKKKRCHDPTSANSRKDRETVSETVVWYLKNLRKSDAD